MEKITLTVGIPAYNEEANIKRLILSVMAQGSSSFILEKIIIFADSCTDKTIEEVTSIKDKRIIVLVNKKRKGKAFGLNTIALKSDSDILVHLDADILINDESTLEKLIEPIIKKSAHLTSARIKEYWATSKFEQVLRISMLMKKEIFEHLNKGNNIYTCHGRARAMSKNLYKSMVFIPTIVAEDAFSYLYAVANGYKYKFASKANVYYRLPRTLSDHKKQSVRFFNSYKQLKKVFGEELLRTETRISLKLTIRHSLKYVLRYPITTFLYICILLKMKLSARVERMTTSTWSVSKSSKSFTK